MKHAIIVEMASERVKKRATRVLAAIAASKSSQRDRRGTSCGS